jgi:hypothetical protein
LREQGQLILQQRKIKTAGLDSEEKKRLISKGKMLLEMTRKPGSPVAAEPAMKPRYNLRSATKAVAFSPAPIASTTASPETKVEDADDEEGWDFDDF